MRPRTSPSRCKYQSFDRSYRRVWEELSQSHDFNLVQYECGFDYGTANLAVKRLLDLHSEVILLFQHNPAVVTGAVVEAQHRGVPIAIHGMRTAQPVDAPYVGFAEYGTCFQLGEKLVTYFRDQYPGRRA